MTLNKYEYIALGIFVGGAIGAAIGSALHQMGAWLPIGIGIGMSIAISIVDRNCAKPPQQKSAPDLRAKS